MSNLSQNPDQEPFVVRSEDSQENDERDLTFHQYLRQVGRSIVPTLRVALLIAPLALIVVVVALSLMGPAIGNVFSNIVNTL